MIIKEKASATGFLAACIFIYMLLVGFKFKYLVFMNAITLSVAFHCQFSFRDRQILPCLFAMASADINPARLHFDPVYLYKSCVFIWQTVPVELQGDSLPGAAVSTPEIRFEVHL